MPRTQTYVARGGWGGGGCCQVGLSRTLGSPNLVAPRPLIFFFQNWHWLVCSLGDTPPSPQSLLTPFLFFHHSRTEKNAFPWSKEKLTELLTSLAFEDEHGSCRTTEISSITGEATAKYGGGEGEKGGRWGNGGIVWVFVWVSHVPQSD